MWRSFAKQCCKKLLFHLLFLHFCYGVAGEVHRMVFLTWKRSEAKGWSGSKCSAKERFTAGFRSQSARENQWDPAVVSADATQERCSQSLLLTWASLLLYPAAAMAQLESSWLKRYCFS